MPRFEMKVYEPLKVDVEFSAVFTIEKWKEIRDALHTSDYYGPAYQLKEAIREMIDDVNAKFNAWPEEKSE